MTPTLSATDPSSVSTSNNGSRPRSALIIVDVQNDFTEGGSLAVSGGADLAARITEYLAAATYDHVVTTRDWHIDPGPHFALDPDFVDTWPPHCVAATSGADFHPALALPSGTPVFSKGAYSAAYSGFEAFTDPDVTLESWLHRHGVSQLDIVGIAFDYCVKATALDAARLGFDTRVLTDLTVAISDPSLRAATTELIDQGVTLSTSNVPRTT